MKFYIGPVTKNTIDTVVQYSLDYNTEFVFIPSRRQIEYNGGYVNRFTTKEFTEYVKSRNNKILIERDHGGPGQGKIDDDGLESLKEDCKYLDIIHIDPWKKYPIFEDALEWTLKLINHCYSLNNNITYEIGTEEGIRPIDSEELDRFVKEVKSKLLPEVFEKIKFLVIQCGTNLLEQTNIGTYDSEKLKRMIEVSKKYNLIAKEHNGDWISSDIVKNKEKAGLTCINIAPEFGEIESSVLITKFKQNPEDLESFFKICYESNTWRKWVSPDFNPFTNKEKLIKICGHYNFTNYTFLDIKSKYQNIDNDICKAIKYRLMELLEIYTVRNKCIFCNNDDLELLFKHSKYQSSLSLELYTNKDAKSYFMPYNVQICKKCNSFQNKYIGDLSIIYDKNHADDYGSTKNKKHTLFCDFISENSNINGIVEVGSCNGILANHILSRVKTEYNIIEPSFTGDKTNLNIIQDYFENVELNSINSNTIVMSDVFEHFYNPIEILTKIQQCPNIKYVYLNHPDFDSAIKNIYNLMILNCEHTFLIEHQFLFTLFEKFGFKLNRRYDFENFSLFLEFERIYEQQIIEKPLINYNLYNDAKTFFSSVTTTADNINKFITINPTKKIYLWPTSVHSITLITCGLNFKKLEGILDNSPNKIGKYLYGYNLLCSSFNDILNSDDKNICIIISGAGSYIKELNIKNKDIDIRYLEDFI